MTWNWFMPQNNKPRRVCWQIQSVFHHQNFCGCQLKCSWQLRFNWQWQTFSAAKWEAPRCLILSSLYTLTWGCARPAPSSYPIMASFALIPLRKRGWNSAVCHQAAAASLQPCHSSLPLTHLKKPFLILNWQKCPLLMMKTRLLMNLNANVNFNKG